MDKRALTSPDDQDVFDTLRDRKTSMERERLQFTVDLDVTPRVDHTGLWLYLESDIREVGFTALKVIVQVEDRTEKSLASVPSMRLVVLGTGNEVVEVSLVLATDLVSNEVRCFLMRDRNTGDRLREDLETTDEILVVIHEPLTVSNTVA